MLIRWDLLKLLNKNQKWFESENNINKDYEEK